MTSKGKEIKSWGGGVIRGEGNGEKEIATNLSGKTRISRGGGGR